MSRAPIAAANLWFAESTLSGSAFCWAWAVLNVASSKQIATRLLADFMTRSCSIETGTVLRLTALGHYMISIMQIRHERAQAAERVKGLEFVSTRGGNPKNLEKTDFSWRSREESNLRPSV